MENELFAELAGLGGHAGNDYSEYADLHTYVERPDDFYKKLYYEGRSLSYAHFYEWDEWNNETTEEKFYYLHRLIMKEIIDFCKRNNIEADYVSLDADHLLDSIKFGKWHAGTDSALTIFDENKKPIVSSM